MLKEKISSFITHDYLDVLRGIAVVMVIAIHAGFTYYNAILEQATIHDNSSLEFLIILARFGSAGPMLFFVISGFLMAMLYNDKYEPKLFFKRRLYRILPLWILFSVLSALASMGSGVYGAAPDISTAFGVAAFILNVSFLSIFFYMLWDYVPGGWSIQAEMVNYGMLHFMKTKGIRTMLSVQLLFSLAAFIFEIIDINQALLIPIQIMATGSFWFFLGVIAANYFKNSLRISLIDITIFTTSAILTMFNNSPNGISQIQSALAILIAILIGVFIVKIKILSKSLVEIGKYSYGIYLMHLILLSVVIKVTISNGWYTEIHILNWFIIIFVTTLFTYVLAVPLYKYLEKPFIDKARKLKNITAEKKE